MKFKNRSDEANCIDINCQSYFICLSSFSGWGCMGECYIFGGLTFCISYSSVLILLPSSTSPPIQSWYSDCVEVRLHGFWLHFRWPTHPKDPRRRRRHRQPRESSTMSTMVEEDVDEGFRGRSSTKRYKEGSWRRWGRQGRDANVWRNHSRRSDEERRNIRLSGKHIYRKMTFLYWYNDTYCIRNVDVSRCAIIPL